MENLTKPSFIKRAIIGFVLFIFAVKFLFSLNQDKCKANCTIINSEYDLINCLDSCSANYEQRPISFKFFTNILFIIIAIIIILFMVNKYYFERDPRFIRLINQILNRNKNSLKDESAMNYVKLPDRPDNNENDE